LQSGVARNDVPTHYIAVSGRSQHNSVGVPNGNVLYDPGAAGSGVRDWLRACDRRGNRADAMSLRICRMDAGASNGCGLLGLDSASTSVRIRATTGTTLGLIRAFHGLRGLTVRVKISAS
jgi:hypothetical protein